MAPAGKSLFASLTLHGAAVLLAAKLVVPQLELSAQTHRDDETWGACLFANIPSDHADGQSPDHSAIAMPPEPATEFQTASVPAPIIAPAEIAPSPLNLIAATVPSSLPAIEPPPTISKKTPRKTSVPAASAQRGGASPSAGAAAGDGDPRTVYSPARYARCPAPPFPDEARKAKISGTVLLLVEVDENGRPASIAVRRSSGHEVLDAAALRAVRTWRFDPARLGGKPVGARLEIPVRFVLS